MLNKLVKITEDNKYKDMFRLEWSDGVLSEDFYNLTRANEILKNYDEYVKDMNIRGNHYRKHALYTKNKPHTEVLSTYPISP